MVQKLRRFYYLLLTAILFLIGASANKQFHLEEQMLQIFQEQNISQEYRAGATKETLASGENKVKEKTMVYASGEPVGIYIKTKGILVLGTQEVKTKGNRSLSPAEHKLESGDYILAMNDAEITSKAQLISCLQKNEDKEAIFTISRKGEEQKIKIKPVYSEENNSYQIGAWIRNDTQGIGTVTYIKENGEFAALGHSISDCDLGVQFNIVGGSVYQTNIASIMKGKEKDPGEIIGTIDYIPENYLGDIYVNTSCGIFGILKNQQNTFKNGDLMEVADASEIQTGTAYLRTSLSGQSKDYTIKITKILLNKRDKQKALQIEVTDSALLDLTGGIIQGLSGAPIIKNGKLLGAVTHVFVDDPTKGYGICAETMVEQGGE